MVVEFERAFADIKRVGDFFCGFALKVKVENGSFRSGKFFETDFERLVVVGIYFVFTRISKPFDFRLSLVDFGGLVFGYDCEFVVAAVFPFVRTFVMDDGGIMLGENKANGFPFIFNIWKRGNLYQNSNGMIIGKSGSGKSFFLKSLIANEWANDTRVIIWYFSIWHTKYEMMIFLLKFIFILVEQSV